jgi:hypothetical protein
MPCSSFYPPGLPVAFHDAEYIFNCMILHRKYSFAARQKALIQDLALGMLAASRAPRRCITRHGATRA